MEGAAKGKKESTRDSLVRKRRWSLVFFALLTICTCFSFGLELLRRRLNGLEETGVELKEVCSKHGKELEIFQCNITFALTITNVGWNLVNYKLFFAKSSQIQIKLRRNSAKRFRWNDKTGGWVARVSVLFSVFSLIPVLFFDRSRGAFLTYAKIRAVLQSTVF